MSVNAENFLQVAEHSLIHANHEMDYRNSISRAYYATFHAVTPISLKLPPVANGNSNNSHELIISTLTNCRPSHTRALELKSIGYQIQRLKAQRVKADYRIDEAISKDDAEEQLRKAKLLLEKIAELKTALQLP